MQRRNFVLSPGARLLQASVLLLLAASITALAFTAPKVAKAPAPPIVIAAP